MIVAGWSAIGGGVLAGAGATYFAVRAANHESRLESRIKSARASQNDAVFSGEDKQVEDDGERAAMWARVLGIGAAGFAAVGVSLLVFGHEPTDSKRTNVSVEWRGDGVSAAYRCAF